MLANVFENFRNKCIEVYETDIAHFMSAHGLAWQACLKRDRSKLELLTDIDMLLMTEKGIRGGIVYAIHRYAKTNNKYMNNYNKDIESLYFMYLDTNNLYGCVMSRKLPVNSFKWIKNVPKFDEDFIKNYDADIDKGYIPEVVEQMLNNLKFTWFAQWFTIFNW